MRVFLAVPTYDGEVSSETMMSVLTAGRGLDVSICPQANSLLGHNFNLLWMYAVEGNFDVFAMIHADVVAEQDWIGKMLEMAWDRGAEVVSAAIPIKDDEGLLSTAWDNGDRGECLTLKEGLLLPPVFDNEDIKILHPQSKGLLLNTGLWVARLGAWARRVSGFQIDSWIDWNSKRAEVISEDWNFSRQLNGLGVKIAATRAIAVEHIGRQRWILGKEANQS